MRDVFMPFAVRIYRLLQCESDMRKCAVTLYAISAI